MKILNPERFDRLPDAVLFDTDNTLYPYDPAHAAAHEAIRKKVTSTFSITNAQFETAFNRARLEIKQQLKSQASSHSRLLYFQRMLEIMGLRTQVMLALDFEQTYWRTFLSHARVFEGVVELLDDLRLAGIPTAIVTDLTAQIQFRKLVYWGLDKYFDYIATSEEAGADKPEPASFLLALEKIRPAGDRIWMIGDASKNDIQGARDAIGAVTIQKIHEGVKQGEGKAAADAVAEDFKQVSAMLRRISHHQQSQKAPK